MSRSRSEREGVVGILADEEITDYEIITSKGTLTYRREDEVIKTADTIEELCDEFVGVMNEDGSHIWYNDEYCGMDTTEYLEIEESFYKKILWNTVKRNVCLGETIYGAIWTDKGLIYVAKMNESGCLELI